MYLVNSTYISVNLKSANDSFRTRREGFRMAVSVTDDFYFLIVEFLFWCLMYQVMEPDMLWIKNCLWFET